MFKIFSFVFVFIFFLGFASAEAILHTPQIITVSSSKSTVPISFFNDGFSQTFSAAFVSENGFAYLKDYSILVDEKSYGSFSLIIGDLDIEPGIYFGNVILSDTSGKIFDIPVIYGKESDLPRKFDVSIDFDESSDLNYISDELVISPNINVYKLDYNPTTLSNIVLDFLVYDLKGEILDSSETPLSVSTRSSFEYFSNLGDSPPESVILVAKVKNSDLVWLDISQVQLDGKKILFSPPSDKREYSRLYFSVFAFLVISIIALSYFWNHRVLSQANDWRSRVNYIKKTQFTDSAKAMRKLKYQKEILQRAYSSHYITKESYKEGLSTIERLSSQFKRHL